MQKYKKKLLQRPFFNNFVNCTIGAEDALEQYDFIDFLMDVSLLLDSLDDFLEILLLAEVFDAAEGEMRHEILSITLITNVVEGCQDIFFELQKFFGCLLHAEPKHTRGVTCAEDAGAVEVHRERVMIFNDFRHCLDDSRLVLRGCLANEFQGEMNVGRAHPVDELLVRETFS